MQRNEWKKKKWIVISAVALILVLAVGTAVYMYTRFDAAEYTQAVLDAAYKNRTEQYQKLSDVSEREAEALFRKNLDTTMSEFQNLELPEELEQNYRELFRDIVKQVKYSVGETEKSKDGGYAVHLQVKPMLLFDDTYGEFQSKAEAYAKTVSDSVMKGAEMPKEEEIQIQVYRMYYEILKEELSAGTKYGKAETLTLHISRTKNGTYEIREKDIRLLNEKLISREKLNRNS